MRRIGILTGGGDCPGLNAAIRGIVMRADEHGLECMGLLGGWQGLLEPAQRKLTRFDVEQIHLRGGTILGTSRTNPLKTDAAKRRLLDNITTLKLDGLIPIGGEDTLGVAAKLSAIGVPCAGVPKTIDNDLSGTDYTFGFDTAVSIAADAIDRLHTTAESHSRAMVVEVMGRDTGWIALHAGVASGADAVLIPEFPFKVEEVCEQIRRKHQQRQQRGGSPYSIIIVSEGAKLAAEGGAQLVTDSQAVDAFGHVRLGGVGNFLAKEIEKRTGIETRATILGHIQRGGTPTARDRVLATRFGVFACDLIAGGRYGYMAALRGDDIVAVPLAEATGAVKRVGASLYELARVFGA
jgi:ATP-dependent phosphofructokinase / diphosphate-dependent phosphofructokinase